MAKRKIIKINRDKCTGCGNCIPGCPEGALQMIDDKATLVSDLCCDGLGACIGECPEGAISIEEREAQPYNEITAIENILKIGSENVIKAHLDHLKEHNQMEYFNQAIEYLKEHKEGVYNKIAGGCAVDHKLPCGCPGTKVMDLRKNKTQGKKQTSNAATVSQLNQWPVQITLVPVNAPYFKDADLLISADCVPFAYPNFHNDFLKGKILLIGCPKLDDAQFYKEKIMQILKENNIKSLTCVHMEVPCCFGLINLVKDALKISGKHIPLKEVTIGVGGEMK